jgi:hypothetical protein
MYDDASKILMGNVITCLLVYFWTILDGLDDLDEGL